MENSNLQKAVGSVFVSRIPAPYLAQAWPVAAKLMESAIEYTEGDSLMSDYLDAIIKDTMQLWGIWLDDRMVAAAVTQICHYPQCKALHGLLIGGGEMDKWMRDLDAALMAFARDAGCKKFFVFGRRGWEPKLKTLGYKQSYVALSKEVNHG